MGKKRKENSHIKIRIYVETETEKEKEKSWYTSIYKLINITELNNEAATDVRGELEERKKEVRETSRKERKKKKTLTYN